MSRKTEDKFKIKIDVFYFHLKQNKKIISLNEKLYQLLIILSAAENQ